MANRTVKDAVSIKGTNPQYLIEKIIRSRIYECRFWKEECFALSAELLVDKAMEMKYIGGVYSGNIKPTPFLCLILKMLQIQPEKDIIVEFIRNEDFKYVRFLGAFYMRLTGSSLDVYKYLEPLYIDYRKMKRLNRNGKFELVHMDEMIDDLLNSERVCDIALPRLQKRHVLEELNQLEIRISPLEENLDDIESSESEKEEEKKEPENKKKEKNLTTRGRSNSRDRISSSTSIKNDKKNYIDYDNPKDDESSKHIHHKRSSSSSSSSSRSRSKSKSKSKSKKRKESSSRHRHRHSSNDRERKHKKKHKHKRSRSHSHSKDKR